MFKETHVVLAAFKVILALSQDEANQDVIQEMSDALQAEFLSAEAAYEEAFDDLEAMNEVALNVDNAQSTEKQEELVSNLNDEMDHWKMAVDFVNGYLRD